MDKAQLNNSIINLLSKNGRMPSKEISERLNVTVQEVDKAIAELEKEHVILGYTAIVQDEAINRDNVRAIIEVEVQPERDTGFDNVARKLSNFPEVRSVYLVSGKYDLRLEVVGKSLQDVAAFVAGKLAPQDGVKSTATYFMLKKYKEAGVQYSQEEKYERLKIVP